MAINGPPTKQPPSKILMKWYYLTNTGEVAGPISQETLSELRDAGALNGDSQICAEGSENWQEYNQALPGQMESATKPSRPEPSDHETTPDKEPKTVLVESESSKPHSPSPNDIPAKGEFTFHCTHCGQRISAKTTAAGIVTECPACSAELHVPQSTAATSTPLRTTGKGMRKSLIVKCICGVFALIGGGIFISSQLSSDGASSDKEDKAKEQEAMGEKAFPVSTEKKDNRVTMKDVENTSRTEEPPAVMPQFRSPTVDKILVKGLWIGMTEKDAKERINKIFNNRLKWKKGKIYEGHLQLYTYSSPELSLADPYTRYCNMEIDVKTKTLASFSVSGTHLDKMFNSRGLEFGDFSQQFMAHFGIAELKSDEGTVDLQDPKRVYYHINKGVKLTFVKRFKDSNYKSFAMFRLKKAGF